MPEYFGIVDRESKNIDPEVKRAVTSYSQQKQRCYNPANNRFEFTGARGIEVHYTCRQFVTWWLIEIEKRAAWKSPTCGRINHNDHYRFGNIELQERAENTREMAKRLPRSVSHVKVERVFPDGTILKFNSVGEAARVTGIIPSLIKSEIDGTIPRREGKSYFRKATGG